MTTTKYLQHPLSAAFPPMSAEEFQVLKDSIYINGVLNPITIFEGMVIDGWHRYSAANDVGMACPSVDMDESIDPKDFVMAQNKARRHILPVQLLAAAKAVYAWAPVGRPNNSATVAELTTKQASEKTGVSIRNVERFKEIEKKAAPEVIASVMSGATGLAKGAAIAKLPMQEQAAAISKPTPRPAAKPAPVVEPEEEAPDYTELDEARDLISGLQSELVVARMGDIPADQKTQAATLIAELKAENKTLEATLKAVTNSRDCLMEERAQMMRQMAMQRKEIGKLGVSQ